MSADPRIEAAARAIYEDRVWDATRECSWDEVTEDSREFFRACAAAALRAADNTDPHDEPARHRLAASLHNACWEQFRKMPSSNPSDYAYAVIDALDRFGAVGGNTE